MPGLKERAKTLVELVDSAAFLFAERPLSLDDKAKAMIAGGADIYVRRWQDYAKNLKRIG